MLLYPVVMLVVGLHSRLMKVELLYLAVRLLGSVSAIMISFLNLAVRTASECYAAMKRINVSIVICLTLSLSKKLLSARFLVCFNYQNASMSLKVGENIV